MHPHDNKLLYSHFLYLMADKLIPMVDPIQPTLPLIAARQALSCLSP